ncbi:ABC transporter substrate-binding protein [Corynebacterium caspium]|uniref:ABC transporter substrate-binding protein n=1 Tax=Corynebacterium caspium TaxID=234828 RepID=UPI000363BC0D|nr:ABC transporter substrate-binding protein [Corynebacterium caspium]WKD59388.1 Glutamine-binding periplasmic protein precursor [Corynebacterium caspium DSM 44850]
MIFRKTLATSAVMLVSLFGLSACVTNEETSTPAGWQQVIPPADPKVQELVPAEIRARGVLTTATNPPFAPFEFKDSAGNIIGVEMDLARAVAAVMGLELKISQQDFALILPSIDGGTIDFGASGFTDNEERRANYDFVNTLYAGLQWAQLSDAPPVDPNNACGLSIAVQRTTVSETTDLRPKSAECVAKGLKPIEILSYDSSDSAATAVIVGRAAAFSADSPVTAWAVERAAGKLKTAGPMFTAAPYGFAAPKGSQLSIALAAAMQSLIDSGDYARILQYWNITDGLIEHALINEKPLGEL